MLHGWIFFFAICNATLDQCEQGFIMARSCAAAEQFIRSGLRPRQVLVNQGCDARP